MPRAYLDVTRLERAEQFAAQLAKALHAVRLTHRTVAQALDITISTVDSWTRTSKPNIPSEANLAKLCALLEQKQAGLGQQVAKAADFDWAPVGQDSILLNINLSDKKHAPLTNLPIPLTNFIGREREVAEVKRLLTRSTQPDVTPSQAPTRLLTLTGAGGVGKTRLANQVATVLLSDFAHGVWLVELAALTDATLAPLAVARALAVNAPTSMSLTDALIEHLRAKHVLLLLDNCEHLVVACAMLVTRLLQACPFLQILATSREPLQVTGETVWRVPSLSLQAAAAQAEAVQFFIANAYASQPSLTLTPHQTSLIHHICQRLDGIPLAIELAAARMRHLTIEQIAARLDDRFTLLTQGRRDALPRHQTLRATLDWSYQLLSEPERELFARLSVFAGGWRLEAAMQLADDLHAESLHTALVDKSLVSAVPRDGVMRYEMLDTVRAYARAQLEATHTATTMRDKHLEIFLRLTEQVEPTLHSSTQNQGLQQLAAEHDNLRAALEWSLSDAPRSERGLCLVSALGWYWQLQEHFSEGREWLRRLLAKTDDALVSPPRAKALYFAGQLAWYQGEQEEAWSRLTHSVELWRTLGNRHTLAYAAALLAVTGFALQHLTSETAFEWLEQSLTEMRAQHDDWGLSFVLNRCGTLALNERDPERAWRYYQEALETRQRLGNPQSIAFSLSNLGEVARLRGDYPRAAALLTQAITLGQQYHLTMVVSQSQANLAYVYCQLGHYAQASSLFKAILREHQQAGSIGNILADLAGLACVAAARQQAHTAAQLFGFVAETLQRFNVLLVVTDHDDYLRGVAQAQTQLDAAAFEVAQSMGRSMTMEQAVELGLGIEDSEAAR